ncbi:MAG: NAD-dependent epimerase/dehydratase family protein, partial [Calditrichaeota bacterium]|nr:NAD-dependent epimerase/dehydratase family protein [Calditrichota bacterium]
MKRILVMGASGQIGSELILELATRYGAENVLASDIRVPAQESEIRFEQHDCMNIDRTAELVKSYRIDTIYHLPALLSATAEKNPQNAF